VGLFGTLASNFIAPFIAFALTVAALLALLYGSSLFGGQAWLSASNAGAIPQIFEMVDLAGRRCFNSVALSRMAPCLQSTGPDASEWQVFALYFDEPDVLATLGGKDLDVAPIEALLRDGEDAAGFAVINDRVVHMVLRPRIHSDLVLLTDVTDTLLWRLASAGSVEVELRDLNGGGLIEYTWRDFDGQPLRPISRAPSPDATTHQVRFRGRYGGYISQAGTDQVFARGKSAITTFVRSFESNSVPGFSGVRSTIYVPHSVMLFYTNWAIVVFIVVTIGVLGISLIRMRTVTARVIQPIVVLSQRVRAMRGRFGGHESSPTETTEWSNAEELVELSYAIDRLEQQLIENELLQRRMRLHERLESIGRLTGGIAHDFNNLLNIVLANCTFLIEDVDNEDILESVRDIEGAAQSAAEMTRGLLAFSSGRSRHMSTGRNVANEVVTTIHLIGRTLGPEVDLQVDVAEVAPTSMSGSQIQQILMNLILNARDASRDSGVSIRVRLFPSDVAPPHRPNDSAAEWLRLVVSDDGIGMDQDTVAHVFDPFFSLKGVGKLPGTGLGLSVVYGLVDGVGGAIEVESDPEKGTTFSVYLPTAPVNTKSVSAQLSAERLQGISVALIEDDDRVRHSVSTLFERMGMVVHQFQSGSAVVEWLSRHPMTSIDLIVTDIRMPLMDGYEVAAHCRAVYPDAPVMFMTGFDPDALNRLMPENSALVMKPMGAAEFLAGASGLSRIVNGTNVPLVAVTDGI